MRMHRGSSKGSGDRTPLPEPLPLSASSAVSVTVEVVRAARSATYERHVAPGTLIRSVVRSVGEAAEGSAVLVDGTSVPLDTPITAPLRLVVVPTFSGG